MKVKLLESFRLSTSYNPFADSMNFSNISISARTKILNNKVDLNFSGTIDPYAIDTNNIRYNKYHGKLGRLTNATISTNFSFSADNGQNKEKKNDLVGGFYDDYVDFDVPWNISVSYNFSYSRSNPYRSPTISQIINFSGDLSLTPKWKLAFQSGYDIKNKEVT